MATFPVKYLNSNMRGAPVMATSGYGSMVGLLDACLLTGFGLVSVTGITVASGVATAAVSSGNSFDVGAVVLIDGATPSALNGEARVLSSNLTSFTFATAAADGAATGTITVKYAPIGGWEKAFSGTNKAVYRSTDSLGSQFYYQIDDSLNTTWLNLRGYEIMSDVDTGSGPFPVSSQVSRYYRAFGSGNPIQWFVFGDSRTILFAGTTSRAYQLSLDAAHLRGFGDAISVAPAGDAWAAFVSSSAGDTANYQIGRLDSGAPNNASSGGTYFARPFAGVGSSPNAQIVALSASETSGGSTTFGTFPSFIDGRLRLVPVHLCESNTPRARVPGVLFVPHSGLVSYFNNGDSIIGEGDLAGRRLVAVRTSNSKYDGGPSGVYFVDATGPWR